MYGYILLTRGPRHFSGIKKVEAAKRQIANLEAFASINGDEQTKLYHDYGRKVIGLESLPKFQRLLEAVKSRGAAIVVDDLQWLFRHAKLSDRKRFLEQLTPFGQHLFDVRLGKMLTQFTQDEALSLITSKDGPFYLKRAERSGIGPAQTKRANRVSAIARHHRSLAKARELAALKKELESGGCETGYAEMARAANDRNLWTTSGSQWSRATARSALLRLAQHEVSKPTGAN